jgi:uncharacterized protein YutE (UPF0331/DUF86 family)
MVEPEIVARKVGALRDHVERIREVLPPAAATYLADRTAQEVVAFNLIQATQSLIDLGVHLISAAGWSVPETFGEIFTTLGARGVMPPDLAERLRRAAGLRNLLVHEYGEIDQALVHEIVSRDLQDLLSAAEHIVRAGPPPP